MWQHERRHRYTDMWTDYKGYRIIKTYRHGYNYYKIVGESTLYSRLKDAKAAIDNRLEVKWYE